MKNYISTIGGILPSNKSHSVTLLLFFLIGTLLPMTWGFIRGFPVPHAQDEFSYTVAADTYAHGRITNPTPPSFESFESGHIIVEPSYISKYPPLQGLFMAIGQILFNQQIFGVWLSCGLMAASLFWMLSIWTDYKWAIVGSVFMICTIGVTSYWAQSYWGGMIAASGGALFLGGVRKTFDKISITTTSIMTIGGIILLNSRPFEGILLMIPSMLILLWWVIKDKTNTFKTKTKNLIVPGIILSFIAITLMCYQYYKVTGNPFLMPYSVHHSQYYPTPLFNFQEINKNAIRGNARIRQTYEKYTAPPVLDVFFDMGFPDTPFLRSIYGFIYLNFGNYYFFFSPLVIPFFFFSLFIGIQRDKWLILAAVTILFVYICMSFGVWWDQYHYVAPLTALFYLFIIDGCRKLTSNYPKEKMIPFLSLFLVTSCIYTHIFIVGYPIEIVDLSEDSNLIRQSIVNRESFEIKFPKRASFFKAEMEKIVNNLPDKYIAIVSYAPSFSFHDEIVYNKGDILSSKLVWAHNLDDQKNTLLIKNFPNHIPLFIKIDSSYISILPVATEKK